MGAFKQFNTNEVTITPFKPEKNFSFTGDEILSASIDIFSGVNTSSLSTNLTSGLLTSYPQASIYGGIRQLYYSNYYSSSMGDPIPTQRVIPGVTPQDDYFYGQVTAPRYENFLQTDTLQTRVLNTGSTSPITVISIPQNLYGEYIKPNSLSITRTSYLEASDDGEGNIFYNSALSGHIFYPHGIIVFANDSISAWGQEINDAPSPLSDVTINFTSALTIHENQYKCTIRADEFNYSMNPTLLTGSQDNNYYSFVTGSNFTPYITTVGLYNNTHDLIAVGKLSQPIPKSNYIDTTIIINFDTI
jgi:hypothetical protein